MTDDAKARRKSSGGPSLTEARHRELGHARCRLRLTAIELAQVDAMAADRGVDRTTLILLALGVRPNLETPRKM